METQRKCCATVKEHLESLLSMNPKIFVVKQVNHLLRSGSGCCLRRETKLMRKIISKRRTAWNSRNHLFSFSLSHRLTWRGRRYRNQGPFKIFGSFVCQPSLFIVISCNHSELSHDTLSQHRCSALFSTVKIKAWVPQHGCCLRDFRNLKICCEPVCLPVRVCLCQCVFFSMLTILLNFNLAAMSSGVSPSCRRRSGEDLLEAQGALCPDVVMLFHTYVISDVGVGVSFQQQMNQMMTFPLTDVVKSRVPLLHSRHNMLSDHNLLKQFSTLWRSSWKRLTKREGCCSSSTFFTLHDFVKITVLPSCAVFKSDKSKFGQHVH